METEGHINTCVNSTSHAYITFYLRLYMLSQNVRAYTALLVNNINSSHR